MKALLIGFSFLPLLLFADAPFVLIQDALKNGWVKCTFTGTDSGHTGRCLKAELINNTKRELNVRFDEGFLLQSELESTQNMVVSKGMNIKLNSGGIKSAALYGLCVEASDASPNSKTTFKPIGMAKDALLEITMFVAKKNAQRSSGQNAVWCITDKYNVESISDEDSLVENSLRQKAGELQLKYGLKQKTIATPIIPPKEYVKFPCKLKYELMENSKVMIALFDKQNKMIEVYVNNEVQRPGIHSYEMEVGHIEKKSGNLYMRVYLNGKKAQEVELVNE